MYRRVRYGKQIVNYESGEILQEWARSFVRYATECAGKTVGNPFTFCDWLGFDPSTIRMWADTFLSQELRSGRSGENDILRKAELSIHVYVYTVQGNPGVVLTPKYCNPIGCSMTAPRCRCYRPAVFFRRLRLFALPFRQGKIRRAFLTSCCFSFLVLEKMALSLQLCKQ